MPGGRCEVEGYCFRCKEPREITNAARVYRKNGKPRMHGYCTVCNARMPKWVKA
jgi:hypothetical protein